MVCDGRHTPQRRTASPDVGAASFDVPLKSFAQQAANGIMRDEARTPVHWPIGFARRRAPNSEGWRGSSMRGIELPAKRSA